MSNDFLMLLRKEIADLEREIANDPRLKKLERLNGVLEMYLADRESPTGSTHAPQSVRVRSTGTRGRVLRLARLFLANRSGPTPTREILAHVTEQGVEVSGKDPVSAVSAMLSSTPEFESHQRRGWTLREDPDIDEDQAHRLSLRSQGIDPDALGDAGDENEKVDLLS